MHLEKSRATWLQRRNPWIPCVAVSVPRFRIMPVVKKLKSGSSHPASPPAEVGVKGKGMAPEPMEVDDGSPQVGEESSGGGSHSELDSELSEASENESGDSLDTDAEIELAQQLPKSKQTLSAHRSAQSLLVESNAVVSYIRA